MTPFELAYVCVEPFMPPLYSEVRRRLRSLSDGRRGSPILDVGGRKSHYTIGVPAKVHVTDLPRRSELQRRLTLGLNGQIVEQSRRRRSNIAHVLYDDMTRSSLKASQFDLVVSVEVLEHVEDDAAFVSEVCRVLKAGGSFLMTTPNGDYLENRNPDHKRHYKRDHLHSLLSRFFSDVTVEYAIKGGRFRSWGLLSWSAKRPLVTLQSMLGNVVNRIESSNGNLRNQAVGTHHLIATGKKLNSRCAA